MGVVYELLIMAGSFRIRFFDRVETADARMTVRQLGLERERPGNPRGNAVDVVCFGGRFDTLTEALDARRAKADKAAATEIDNDVRVAQAIHNVPVTGITVDAEEAVAV